MKTTWKKMVVLGSLMVVLVGLLGACQDKNKAGNKGEAKDQWSEIKKKKEVVMGLDDTFVPMGFKNKQGEIVGFDVDLAKAVFKLYGITVKTQPIDWSMKEKELTNGTIDLIWNGYSATPQRRKKVAFSQTYMKNEQILVTPKSSGINQLDKMTGKILGAQNGSSGYDIFVQEEEVLKNKVKDQEAVLYDTFNEGFIDLEAGRIDGLLIDKVYANYYLAKKDQLNDYYLIGNIYQPEDFAVGIRKSDKELQTKLNEGFEQLEKDGSFAKISDKWFGEDVSPK
ncbi:amino acid ABC transporter substrate-binding protein [Vagococcus humatus]|uniref:Amino acid ABC transporter substrate-binding protein n=2 Tax=Vagococcus humatus TaxID=1889241 RepID=A0A3R9YE09_9ENTE|nr:amino acid ABC transporter substrate-binding protein [Vagococcus humatus]